MSYADAFKVAGGGDAGWLKKAPKAKRPPKPEPFTTTLTFVAFATGRKAIFKDPAGVRHFMKLDVFQEMLTKGFPGNGEWEYNGLWITRTWITVGRARLTRPVEEA